MAERYKTARFDAEHRLHREDGPAIECRDGFSVYAWHGVRIPKEWICEGVDPSVALQWENVEQRRAAIEILGWREVLNAVPHRVVDADPDPSVGKLYEIDLPDAPKQKLLEARCGTGRTVHLLVDPSANTALEANAASYGIDPEQLLGLEVRT